MKNQLLIPMVQYILDIDWLTTVEFCDKYGVPHPKFTGEVESSANQFLQVDAVKHRMFVDYAKLLNKEITTDKLVNNLGFTALDVRGGYPMFQNGKYKITNDEFGFWFEPYDSVDGCRVSKLSDLVIYGLTYNE